MFNQTMVRLGSRRSEIREIAEYGRKRVLEAGARNVFDFSLGNPNIPAPREVTDAILDIANSQDPVSYHSYTSSEGRPETRRAIAEDLNRRFGTAYTAGELFLTCGAAASLNIALRALISGPQDEIITVAPFFPEYSTFVSGQGGRFVAAEPDPATLNIDPDRLEAALTPQTKAMILNTPNNPTGAVVSEKLLGEVAARLTRKSREFGHPIYLLSDEPYRELVYGDSRELLPAMFYPNTIISYSWSKSLSLPGERIGYLLVPDALEGSGDLRSAIAGAARCMGHVCAPSLFQQVIERCITVRPDLSVYQRNRDLLLQELSAMGYRLVPPEGAFYAFIASPSGDSEEFCARARKRDLLLVPGTGFGFPSHARLSYCVSTEILEASLPVFRAVLEEYRTERIAGELR